MTEKYIKIIIVLIIVIVQSAFFNITVFASNIIVYPTDNNQVVVQGSGYTGNEEVGIMVIKPNIAGLEGIDNMNPINSIEYIDQVTADTNGSFDLTFSSSGVGSDQPYKLYAKGLENPVEYFILGEPVTPTPTPTLTPTPTPSPTPTVAPVIASDSTVVLNPAPAGMKTRIQDLGTGFIEVTCSFKGLLNVSSFTWALSFDKSKVTPVTAVTKADMPSSKLLTAAAISPYYEITGASKLAGYNVSSSQIENTTGALTGNYLMIGYLKNTGAVISLDGASEVSLLKMTFRKIAEIGANTFGYFHKTAGGTVVSKLVYGTTNVLQYATSTGATTFTRPDNFTSEMIQVGNEVSFTSLSAADLLDTGDKIYDDYLNPVGITVVTVKSSYLATEVLVTTTVDPTTKRATIPKLADGNYVFNVSRNGYMYRDISVTIAGGNLDLGDKSLWGGDVYSDGIIDGSDSETLFSYIGLVYGNDDYYPEHDLNLDGIIDGTDTEILFTYLGYDVSYYGETVDYYN